MPRLKRSMPAARVRLPTTFSASASAHVTTTAGSPLPSALTTSLRISTLAFSVCSAS